MAFRTVNENPWENILFQLRTEICTNYEGKPPRRAIKRHLHRGKCGTGGGVVHCVAYKRQINYRL